MPKRRNRNTSHKTAVVHKNGISQFLEKDILWIPPYYSTLNDVGIFLADSIAANDQSSITNHLGFSPTFVKHTLHCNDLIDSLISQGIRHWTHTSKNTPFLDNLCAQATNTHLNACLSKWDKPIEPRSIVPLNGKPSIPHVLPKSRTTLYPTKAFERLAAIAKKSSIESGASPSLLAVTVVKR